MFSRSCKCAVVALIVGVIGSSAALPETAKLTASNGAYCDYFGDSVAINGSTIVVGAPNHNTGGVPDAGAAYVFEGSGPAWSQTAILSAPVDPWDIAPMFGFSVGIGGDVAVGGAPYASPDGAAEAGAAYVFVRGPGAWGPPTRLPASPSSHDHLGWSAAIDSDTIVVGAPHDNLGQSSGAFGSAYVFVRSGEQWLQAAKLTNSVPCYQEQFGWTVAISGDTVVVGANRDGAYVFEKPSGGWSDMTETAVLMSCGSNPEDSASVAIDGDTIVVGKRYDDVAGLSRAGRAYVFVRSRDGWTCEATLTAPQPQPDAHFGEAVAIAGGRLVAAAPADGALNHSGWVFLFARCGGTWTFEERLEASDPAERDFFGSSVAFCGDTVVAGAPLDDLGEENCGSAYVFQLPSATPCDLDCDGDVDADDYGLFRIAFGHCLGDPAYRSDADYDGDGCITFIDYQEWLMCYRAAR